MPLFGGSLLVLAGEMNADPGNPCTRHASLCLDQYLQPVRGVSVLDTDGGSHHLRTGQAPVWRTCSRRHHRGLIAPVLTDFLVGRVGRTGVLIVSASLFAVAIVCQMISAAALASGSAGNERGFARGRNDRLVAIHLPV